MSTATHHHTTNPWGGSADLPDTVPPHTSPPHPKQRLTTPLSSLINIGLLRTTLLPSLALNTTLAALAYATGRATDRLETKDLARAASPALNAWYAAVLRYVKPFAAAGSAVSVETAWRVLGKADKVLLGGVTLWGGRVVYRVVRRAKKRGRDKRTYEAVKKGQGPHGGLRLGKGGFWDWAWLTVYLPEAVVQSLVAVSVTAPFRMVLGETRCVLGLTGCWKEVGRAVAVGLFGAGFALEVLADRQLGEFKGRAESQGKMCRDGVWGVVRHPNFLGDALVNFSFPLFLFANNLLAPVALLGPLANYLFLRCVGGDKEKEESQARRYGAEDVAKKIDFDKYRHEINAFWPDVSQIHNKWTWIVVGCGTIAAAVQAAVWKLL